MNAGDIPFITTKEWNKLFKMYFGLRCMYGPEKALGIMESYSIDTKPIRAWRQGKLTFVAGGVRSARSDEQVTRALPSIRTS